MSVVLRERHVPQERHPIVLGDLGRLFGAAEGGGRPHGQGVGIRPLHVEGQSGLGVDQPGAATDHDALEISGTSRPEGTRQGAIGNKIHLPQVVVRQSFGIARDLVGVEVLVAVGRMVDKRPLPFGPRRLHPDSIRLPLPSMSRCRALGLRQFERVVGCALGGQPRERSDTGRNRGSGFSQEGTAARRCHALPTAGGSTPAGWRTYWAGSRR